MIQKITFEPRLLRRDTEAINKQVDDWKYAAKVLNELAADWHRIFNEKFSIDLLNQIFSEKSTNIERFLQIHFINLDPEYAKFAEKMKIEVALQITKFPDFGNLPDFIKNIIKPNIIGKILDFNKWIDSVCVEGVFEIPAQLIEAIELKNTFYTKNLRENLVVVIFERLAGSINILNDMGAAINLNDLPLTLKRGLTSTSTGIQHDTMEKHFSEGRFSIMHMVPSIQFSENSNPILSLINANLTDEEVEKLYAELTAN